MNREDISGFFLLTRLNVAALKLKLFVKSPVRTHPKFMEYTTILNFRKTGGTQKEHLEIIHI